MSCCLTDPLTCLLAHLDTYLAAYYPLAQLLVYFYTWPNLHTCLLTQSVKPTNEVCCISDIKNIIHQLHVRFLAPLLNKFLLSHLYICLHVYRVTCFHTHVFAFSNRWLTHLPLTFMPTYLSICVTKSTADGGPCNNKLRHLITLQRFFECLHVVLSILFCPSDF